jgi:hypothetical protein
MSTDPRLMNRRNFLKAAAIVTAGSATGLGGLTFIERNAARHIGKLLGGTVLPLKEQHVGFTDGWISMPNDAAPRPPFWPDPGAPIDPVTGKKETNGYVFGIRNLMRPTTSDYYGTWGPMSEATMFAQKGRAQLSAPILFTDQGADFKLHLHNLGEQQRPVGNPDNHTIHFHGFTNQIVYFDGVPDTSIAAAIGRELIYHYYPEDPGSYMYHCHIDDVEHVHMGLYGIVFIRCGQLSPYAPGKRQAFDDPPGLLPEQQSWYDREYAMIITEFDVHGHWNDAHNQDTDWSEYNGSFRLMNGRAWPDTIQPHTDPMLTNLIPGAGSLPNSYWGAGGNLEHLRFNPNSSLIQGKAGERILVRISNLGFEEHSLLLPGIPLTVVGRDAKPLYATRPDYGVDNTANGAIYGSRADIQWTSNRVDLGPGESRDMIITLPQTGQSGQAYDAYPFYDRNYGTRAASTGSGVGGMRTEVHVYNATNSSLPDQRRPAAVFVPDGSGGWIETWASGTQPMGGDVV